jgi:hypothetical protein
MNHNCGRIKSLADHSLRTGVIANRLLAPHSVLPVLCRFDVSKFHAETAGAHVSQTSFIMKRNDNHLHNYGTTNIFEVIIAFFLENNAVLLGRVTRVAFLVYQHEKVARCSRLRQNISSLGSTWTAMVVTIT